MMGEKACGFNFVHKTSAARPILDQSSKFCRFFEEDHGKTINLRDDLGRDKNDPFVIDDKYLVNICGEISDCEKDYPTNCIKSDDDELLNLGKLYNSFYQGEVFTVVYRDGDKCIGNIIFMKRFEKFFDLKYQSL
jgi:hypothetical protein